MSKATELTERAGMFEERAEERPIQFPGNIIEKWLSTIDRCRSSTRKRRIRRPADESRQREPASSISN